MKYFSNDKKRMCPSIILFMILVIMLCIGVIVWLWCVNDKIATEYFNDYFDCYLKLTDINPQFVSAYMKFDNKHVSSGKCKDARLHVVVEPCVLDSNGMPDPTCNQSATLTSSKGNPIEFPYEITPINVGKYFGIKL